MGDTWDLVMFSIHVTFWVMIILLVNGCSVIIGLLFHKCCPSLDTTCIPVVSKFSKITAILCMLLTLFRCFANLFCTAKLPGIIFTGNRCETMYSTALHSFLVADFFGLLQVALGVVVAVMASARETKEVSAYLLPADENPEAATRSPA